jgi:hypothetical protein
MVENMIMRLPEVSLIPVPYITYVYDISYVIKVVS